MAQNGVNIPIRTDTSQAEKGIDKLTGKFNNLKRQLDGNDPLKRLNDSYNDLTSAISSSGLGMAISAELDILKSEFEWIEKTTEAYKIQLKAETQLAQAARNNPYLNNESVENLKKFASSVQTYSEYGDEFLMPFMAQLATAGRNEEEIMKIISVSADIAASGTMDFASAVTNLNKSLTGSIGKMSAGDIELKNLTKEELESGKAIDVLAQKYSGMAQEVALATGALTQYNNAAGDLQETFGKINKPTSDMLNNFKQSFTEFTINTLDPFIEKLRYTFAFGGGVSDLKKAVEWIQKVNKDENGNEKSVVYDNKVTLAMLEDQEQYFKTYLKYNKELTKEQQDAYLVLKDAIKLRKNEEALRQKQLLKEKEILAIQEDSLKGNLLKLEQTDSQIEKQKLLAETEKANYNEIEEQIRDLETEATGTRDLMKDLSPDTADYEILKNQLGAINQEIESLYDTQSKMTGEASTLISLEEREKNLLEEIANKRAKLLDIYKATVDKANENIKIQHQAGIETTKAADLKKVYETSQKAYIDFLAAGGEKNLELEAELRSQKAALTREEITEQANASKKQYLTTISNFNAEIEARKKLGEVITDEQKKEEELATRRQALLTLFSGSKGTVTINNSQAQQWIKDYKDLLATVQTETENADIFQYIFDDIENDIENFKEIFGEDIKGALESEIEFLENVYNDDLINYSEYIASKELLEKELTEVLKLENQKRIEDAQKTISILQSSITEIQSTIDTLSDMAINNAENRATIDTAKAEEKYNRDLISYEEYQNEIDKINKEADKKRYKAEMWKWSINLLNITANTANAVMGAYASNPTLIGASIAALIGVAGAAQLSAAIGAKPIPPSYAGGGFIGGMQGVLSGGDDSIATVKRGEMILNGTQQRNLLNLLSNGNNSGMNVNIKNYMGGQADVKTQLTADGLSVIIKQQIQNEFNNGNLDGAILSSQNRQGGVLYTS